MTDVPDVAELRRILAQQEAELVNARRLNNRAIGEERARLAQEMHDELGQLIGSIHVWAEEARSALEEADTAAALLAVERIEAAAQDAYATLRDEILDLRLALAPSESIVPVLRKSLDRFRRQWGIATEFAIDGPDGDGRLDIPAAQEIQLLRVIQEALTNVRRHARASRVTARMAESADAIAVVIEDDGRGFDPAGVGEEQFGLRIMRERASSVGGELLIDSQPGRGTRLTIRLPRAGAGMPAAGLPGENSDVPDAPGR